MSDCIGTGCKAASLMERIAALEAERDCANARADTHLADAYSMRNQRDALAKVIEAAKFARIHLMSYSAFDKFDAAIEALEQQK